VTSGREEKVREKKGRSEGGRGRTGWRELEDGVLKGLQYSIDSIVCCFFLIFFFLQTHV